MSLTSTQKTGTNTVEMEIVVGAEELKAATDKVFQRKIKTLTVPGFRKGKAPRGIVEKMYGEGIFMEDAVNDLFPSAYEAAVEEVGIAPVDKAEVEVLTLDKNTGFTFKATVTVKPEVTVRNYKGITAEKVIAKISSADVDAEIDKMRERNSRQITVEDRAAQQDDQTVIDFEGFIDGVAFPGGQGDGYQLTLGSGSFIDTFEDQIIGHKIGEEFDVNVTFPEDYHAEELKGKPALFKVRLNEIKAKELPELDDEFAKDVSEFDTLDELKKDIAAKLQERKDAKSQEDFENLLIDQVVEGLEGEIPECMFDHKVDEMVRDFEYRLSSQGMKLDMYLQYTGMDEESFRKTFQEQSERQVKIRLALEKIAQLEGIEVPAEDLEAELKKLAEAYEMDVEKIKTFVPEKDIIADIQCTKAIDVIKDSAVAIETAEKAEEAEEISKKKATVKKTAKAEKSSEE